MKQRMMLLSAATSQPCHIFFPTRIVEAIVSTQDRQSSLSVIRCYDEYDGLSFVTATGQTDRFRTVSSICTFKTGVKGHTSALFRGDPLPSIESNTSLFR